MHRAELLHVLAMGRSWADVYLLQIGVGLDDVDTFGKYLGGSAASHGRLRLRRPGLRGRS